MIRWLLILNLISSVESLGKIKGLSGDVLLIRGGHEIAPAIGQVVEDGDEIRTGGDSYVIILLEDNSEIKVDGSSRLVLKKELLMKDTAIERVLYSLKLLYGKLIMKIEKRPEQWLNVGTPTSIIGVRGTGFSAGVAGDGSTIVDVTDGVVEVLDDETLRVSAGERAEYDPEEGLKIIPSTGEINWDEWFRVRRERFLKRKKILAEILHQRLENRVKRMESVVEELEKTAEEGEREKMKEKISALYNLRDNLETGIEFLKYEGIRIRFEERFREVERRWAERKRAVAERFELRRREIERRFQERRNEIEERFKNRRK